MCGYSLRDTVGMGVYMIIIRHRLRRIFAGAFQSILLFISIAVSATLAFASLQVSGVMRQVEMDQSRNQFGNSDIIIEPNPELNETKRINVSMLGAFESDMQYCLPVRRSLFLSGDV